MTEPAGAGPAPQPSRTPRTADATRFVAPLWPAAAAAWAVAALYAGPGISPGAAATGGAGLACGALACWYAARRLGRLATPGGRPPGRRWMLLLALALACAGAASVLGGAAADGATRGAVVRQWGDGRLIQANVELSDAPHELRNGSLLVAATLLGVREQREDRWLPAGSLSVTVIGAPERFGSAGLEAGARLAWWVTASAPPERAPAALTLSPRSAPLATADAPDDLASTLRGGLGRWLAPLRGGPLQEAAALVPGMVVGDRSGQSPALATAMQRAGLSHLTAVSGANVALLLGASAAFLRLVRVPRVLLVPALLAVLCGFVLVVGPDPSVLRAAVSGALGAIAVVAGRPRAALGLTLLAVVVLLSADPWHAGRVAFQLSVAATLGIALLAPALAEWMRERLHLPRLLADAVAVSAAATVACTPLLVLLAPEQSALTVLVNVLAAPAAAVVGLLGPALALAAPLLPPASWPLGLVCLLPAQWVALLGQLSADHGPFLAWPSGPAGPALAVVGCWGLPAAVLLRARRRADRARRAPPPGQARSAAREPTQDRQRSGSAWLEPPRARYRRLARRARLRRWGAVSCLALTAGGLGAWLGGAGHPAGIGRAGDGELLFCDVGQGDALALIGDGGSALLIDVGPPESDAVGCLRSAGVTRLCGVLLTHLHADHAGALPKVLKAWPGTPVHYSTAGREPPVPEARRAASGEAMACGSWRVTITLVPRAAEENNASLVVNANTHKGGGLELLDAGDLEDDGAALAVTVGAANARTDAPRVLKVSHHGSRDAGMRLVDAFAPRLALIGVGEGNDYGHPSAPTLDGLAARGVPVLRTDLRGTLLVRPGAAAGDDPRVSTSR